MEKIFTLRTSESWTCFKRYETRINVVISIEYNLGTGGGGRGIDKKKVLTLTLPSLTQNK